ncbi:hypothetical protein B9Z19DRAFT_562246 [Tuber borchii]|uniref:Uncharacterized protein n=1 Tax=Tuber borchii TaxID=42251 RepID=A0A2T7A8K3_TUBBO|nr:hypothetical protein B9Z19DRAFT_562246 [Tuber borchii]
MNRDSSHAAPVPHLKTRKSHVPKNRITIIFFLLPDILVAEIYDMMMGGKCRREVEEACNNNQSQRNVCMYVRTRGKPMGKKRVPEYAPRNSASDFVIIIIMSSLSYSSKVLILGVIFLFH